VVRIVLAIVFATACESGADIVEEMRPRAETRMAAMQAATKAAIEKPVTTPPELPEKLRFHGDGPNAYIVHPEWLEVPPRPAEREIVIQANDFITIRNVLLGKEAPSGVAAYYRKAFDEFLAVKWLVVVGNGAFNAGAVTGDSTFAGGGWNGTLHFVEIDEGGSVGSITVDASASDTVEVVEGREAEHLSSDVWINARAAINDSLAPFTASGDKPL
jgi:hypothetical protein